MPTYFSIASSYTVDTAAPVRDNKIEWKLINEEQEEIEIKCRKIEMEIFENEFTNSEE
jgi:hypothetical protein